MQGIFLETNSGSLIRPATKASVKQTAKERPERVRIEATSLFGDEYNGILASAPVGQYSFVGPNPRTDRRFYGTITKKADGSVVVK